MPTSTEIARFRTLLAEYKDILHKIDRNNGRISNEEKIQLQMLRKSMQEMFRNEDLKERFYFDVLRAEHKIKEVSNKSSSGTCL